MNPKDKKNYERIVKVIREIPKNAIVSEQYIKRKVEEEGIEVLNMHSVLQRVVNGPYFEMLSDGTYRRTER